MTRPGVSHRGRPGAPTNPARECYLREGARHPGRERDEHRGRDRLHAGEFGAARPSGVERVTFARAAVLTRWPDHRYPSDRVGRVPEVARRGDRVAEHESVSRHRLGGRSGAEKSGTTVDRKQSVKSANESRSPRNIISERWALGSGRGATPNTSRFLELCNNTLRPTLHEAVYPHTALPRPSDATSFNPRNKLRLRFGQELTGQNRTTAGKECPCRRSSDVEWDVRLRFVRANRDGATEPRTTLRRFAIRRRRPRTGTGTPTKTRDGIVTRGSAIRGAVSSAG
jgi:hypothetical protein